MNYPLTVEVFQCAGEFGHPEADDFLLNITFTFQVDCKGAKLAEMERKGRIAYSVSLLRALGPARRSNSRHLGKRIVN